MKKIQGIPKYYHVTEEGLVEGEALGRISVVLKADYEENALDASSIRGWEVGAKLFRSLKEAQKYVSSGMSDQDGNGSKVKALYRKLKQEF